MILEPHFIAGTSSSAGICYTSAAHGDSHDDAQLLLHHTEPAGPRHAAVRQLHAAVLSRTWPSPRKPRVPPEPSRPQQSPQPRIRHAVLLYLVQRKDAAAAAAAVAADATTVKVSTAVIGMVQHQC